MTMLDRLRDLLDRFRPVRDPGAIEAPEPGSLTYRWARLFVTSTYRLAFYSRLQSLHANETQIRVALEKLYFFASKKGRKPGEPGVVMLAEVLARYRDGLGLARSLEGWAPDEERMLIEAGEQSGRLAEALQGAIDVTMAGKEMKKAIVAAIAYPVFNALAAVGVLLLFGRQVLPAFADVIPVSKWTGDARSMAGLTQFTEFWMWVWIAGFVAFGFAVAWTLPRWSGRHWLGRLRIYADRIPPYSFYRDLVGTRFLLAFTAMQSAGVPPSEAMERLQGMARPWLRDRIVDTLERIRDGRNLGEALDETGYQFPAPRVIEDLSIYSESKHFDRALTLMARQSIDGAISRVKGGARALNYVGMIGIAGLVMYMTYGLFALIHMASNAKI